MSTSLVERLSHEQRILKKLLPARAVATRYDVCLKSLDRWLEEKILPEPVRIRGRRYWYEDDLVKLERASWGVYDCHNPLKPGAVRRAKETVSEVTCIVIDMDFKDIVETPAEADARVNELLLPFSWYNDSGHGRHGGFQFKEPISTDDAPMIARVDAVRARLIEILCGDRKVSHHAALIRRVGTHNSKGAGEWLEVKTLSACGAAYDLTELEELVSLYDRPLLTRKPATNGGADSFVSDEPKPPIDAEQRLAAMRYRGSGDSSINTTWWDCMGSLLRRGMTVADVIDTLHAAAEANCGDDPNKANWYRDLAGMATRWLTHEPEFVHGLDANSYKQWQAAVVGGKKPRLVWSQNYGLHVRGMTQAGEPGQEKAQAKGEDGTKKEEEPHKPGRGLAIFSSSAFTAGFIPPDYLIDGVVQRRFLYSFTGPTGHGKTAVLLLIAAHVGLGRALGNHGIEQGHVLVLAGENPDDVRMRWIAMAEHLGFDPKTIPVHFLPGVFPMAVCRLKEVARLAALTMPARTATGCRTASGKEARGSPSFPFVFPPPTPRARQVPT